MQPENSSDSIENLTDSTFNKNNIITAIAVFMLSIFVITLFLINKAEWEKKILLLQTDNTEPNNNKANKNTAALGLDKALAEAAQEDSQQNSQHNATITAATATNSAILENENKQLRAELQSLKVADSLRINSIATLSSYKIYGLYKDKSGKQKEAAIAQKFNIKSEKAIKSAEVGGEKAFVVPVRGIHIAKNGDTAFSIARKYYKNEQIASLIEEFNGEIQAGMIVFLPFD